MLKNERKPSLPFKRKPQRTKVFSRQEEEQDLSIPFVVRNWPAGLLPVAWFSHTPGIETRSPEDERWLRKSRRVRWNSRFLHHVGTDQFLLDSVISMSNVPYMQTHKRLNAPGILVTRHVQPLVGSHSSCILHLPASLPYVFHSKSRNSSRSEP